MAYTQTRTRHQAGTTLLNISIQLLLLAAIPIALWKLSGNPIPHQLPGWADLQEQWRGIEAQPVQLAAPVLRLLADLLWIAWAWYAGWTGIAILWVLLHLPRTILPGALAAITPAIALRALSLGALAAHPAAPVATASVATAPAAPAPVHLAQAAARTQPDTAATVDIVEPGDNLWDLAEHYYHQGQDWQRIYHANRDVNQPDGQRLTDPGLIQPGWRLTIPGIPAPDATASPAAPAPAARPAPAPPHTPATARPGPTRAPGGPAPAPAATAAHTPTPAPTRHPGPAARPAPEQPHTVGHALPDDAGYIGITLITAVAASVAILRTRNRRRGRPTNQDIPGLAQHLAAVHSLARSAQTYGYRPEDHPDMDTPPLYQPLDQHATIATSPDDRHEVPFTPDTLPGPLVLTGPGARDAARALAISTLAAGHELDIDPQTATELLGTPAPTQPENPAPGPTSIRTAPAHPDQAPGTVILDTPGNGHDPGPDSTVVQVTRDGTVEHTAGPGADRYAGTRLHTLAAQPAATLHQHLKDAAPANPMPHPAIPEQNTVVSEPDDQPDQDTDLRTLTDVPMIVRILGHLDIHGPTTAEPVPVTAERPAAVLTLLALHPDGVRPRKLHELEWASAPDVRRARIALTTTVNRLRNPLRAALGDRADELEPVYFDKATGTYRLNPDLVTTDLAIARGLTTRAQADTDPNTQTRLLTQAATVYQGQLAPRIDDHQRDWLTTARYTLLTEATRLHLRIADLTAATRSDTAAHYLTEAVALTPEDPETVIAALRVCHRIQRPELAQTLYHTYIEALRPLNETVDPRVTQALQDPSDASAHRRQLPER